MALSNHADVNRTQQSDSRDSLSDASPPGQVLWRFVASHSEDAGSQSGSNRSTGKVRRTGEQSFSKWCQNSVLLVTVMATSETQWSYRVHHRDCFSQANFQPMAETRARDKMKLDIDVAVESSVGALDGAQGKRLPQTGWRWFVVTVLSCACCAWFTGCLPAC